MTREQFLRCFVACFLIAIALWAMGCEATATISSAPAKPAVEAPDKFRQLYLQKRAFAVDTMVRQFEVWEGPAICLVIVWSHTPELQVIALPIDACSTYRAEVER